MKIAKWFVFLTKDEAIAKKIKDVLDGKRYTAKMPERKRKDDKTS